MPFGSGRSSNRTCVTFNVTNCFSPLTPKCHCFNARRLEKYPDIVAGNLTMAGSRTGLLQSCVCVTIAGQQSIDISWPPGAQQQTRRTLLQRSVRVGISMWRSFRPCRKRAGAGRSWSCRSSSRWTKVSTSARSSMPITTTAVKTRAAPTARNAN